MLKRRACCLALAWAALAVPARAQQPSVQIVAASQFSTGDDLRLGGQRRIEPDLGFRLFDPGFRFGTLEIGVNLTRRDEQAAVGRKLLRLDGVDLGGLRWSFGAGDLWMPPAVPDFGFANLFAPPVTLLGGLVTANSPRTSLSLSGGQVTAQRNIFGTDSLQVGQQLYQASLSHRVSEQVDLSVRAEHLSGRDVTYYTSLVDRSTDAGAGIQWRPGAAWQLSADGGYSAFRRHGSPVTERAPSWLVGAIWSGARGWFQINGRQFQVGRYPVVNYPHVDREGVFAAGEVDLLRSARLFGGTEYARSDIARTAAEAATANVAPGTFLRGYGGIRVSFAERSLVTLRVETGDRKIEPSKFGSGYDTNTGIITAEWHTAFGKGNAFARYERRANVDALYGDSSFTQHDASGQFYYSVGNGRQVFAQAVFSRRADRGGDGQTLWQAGGGTQLPLSRFYLRVEANAGRTVDWSSDAVVNRQSLLVGFSGQIAPRTYLSVDCFVDHTPQLGTGINPWLTRTMVRLTKEFIYGTARAPRVPGAPGEPGELVRRGPTGTVLGVVFIDWNADGSRGQGEDGYAGVGLSLDRVALRSGADGRFRFDGVPVGDHSLAVDMANVPADYDPPADAELTVGVVRGQTTTVEFGLVPVGTVAGTVIQDVDGDGKVGDADRPVAAGVLVLDDGARSEVVRDGRFRFESVRVGAHTVTLLLDSLPEGAQLTGPASAPVELTRDRMTTEVTFLVKLEKRPEIRKVFPPKK